MRELQDKPGYALALLLMLGMSIAIWVMHPVVLLSGSFGLCAPSPEQWAIPAWLSCTLNAIGVVAISLLMIFLNKRFNIVSGSSILFASVFLVMTGANPWVMQRLGSATIMALASVISLWMLFSCFGKRNVTHTVFLLFTIFSFGSMIQYSFLLLALAFLVGLSYMKVLRLKEILAMLCGLIAPYWICLGFGLIQPDQINWPTLTNLFAQGLPARELTGLILFAAAGAVATLVPGFLNYRTVFATNGQIRGCNGFILTLGVICIWFMVFDFSNLMAYMAVLNITAGIQIAHLYKNSMIRREYLLPLVITVVYLAIFTFTLI